MPAGTYGGFVASSNQPTTKAVTATIVLHQLDPCRFELVTITDEYTHTPADRSSSRATWTARRLAP